MPNIRFTLIVTQIRVASSGSAKALWWLPRNPPTKSDPSTASYDRYRHVHVVLTGEDAAPVPEYPRIIIIMQNKP